VSEVKKIYTNDDKETLRKQLFRIGDEDISKNVFYSIKSRYKILYIVSSEEDRIIKYFKTFCISEAYTGYIWDCSRGLIDIFKEKPESTAVQDITEPEAILSYLIDTVKKGKHSSSNGRIYLLLDFHRFLDDAEPILERKLKEFAHYSEADCVVIVAPEYICGSTLDKEVTMVDFPYPSKFEIEETLDNIRQRIVSTNPKIASVAKDKKEDIIHAVSGLTIKEARNAFAKTVVQDRTFKISTLLREKELIVKKSGLLEICNTDMSISDVGGFEALKYWLNIRKSVFSDDAKIFGLPEPKGVLFCGIPGCGKSLTAKAVASLFEMPLLRLDMGAMFGSRVGESERRIREALKGVESVSPAILWLDEIEKGISGASSSSHTDGGTTARVVSTLLTWMQEKKHPVFVIATANKTSDIPPEFMRAGRFDEVFFLDLPNSFERADIAGKILNRKKRDPKKYDLLSISKSCDGYVGAEIEKAIDNALFLCYHNNKMELTTELICSEFSKFIPLSKSRKEEIDAMREWAKTGGAIIANSSEACLEKVYNEETLMLDMDDDNEEIAI
jgi:ATP-dependent 26S proteasome regulatory subunit